MFQTLPGYKMDLLKKYLASMPIINQKALQLIQVWNMCDCRLGLNLVRTKSIYKSIILRFYRKKK